jgi:hypothetical protein
MGPSDMFPSDISKVLSQYLQQIKFSPFSIRLFGMPSIYVANILVVRILCSLHKDQDRASLEVSISTE